MLFSNNLTISRKLIQNLCSGSKSFIFSLQPKKSLYIFWEISFSQNASKLSFSRFAWTQWWQFHRIVFSWLLRMPIYTTKHIYCTSFLTRLYQLNPLQWYHFGSLNHPMQLRKTFCLGYAWTSSACETFPSLTYNHWTFVFLSIWFRLLRNKWPSRKHKQLMSASMIRQFSKLSP